LCEQFILLVKNFEEDTKNYDNYLKIVNLSLYLLIIIYNERKYKAFLEYIFDKDSNLIVVITKLLTLCQNLNDQKDLAMIYSTIFYDEDFIAHIKSVEPLINHHKSNLSKFNLQKIEIYPNLVYYSILEYLIKVDYTFEELFEKKICEDSDKPAGKFKNLYI